MEIDKWVSVMILLEHQVESNIFQDFFLCTKPRLMEELSTEWIRIQQNDKNSRKRGRKPTTGPRDKIDGDRQRRDVVRMKSGEGNCEISGLKDMFHLSDQCPIMCESRE